MNNEILIVGGTGYLGRHLRTYISSEYSVFVTGTAAKKESNYYQIDFLNPETFASLRGKQFDIVIIAASSLKGLGNSNLNHPDLQTNTVNLASFLQFVSDDNITSKIVYISSMTVYAPAKTLPVTENWNLKPLSVYGLSKKIAEDICSFFSEKNCKMVLILRLPGIYGGDRKAGYIYNLIINAIKNEVININTTGLGYWESMEINDVCKTLLMLIKNYKWEKELYTMNIGYGDKTDFIETANFVVKELESKSEIIITNSKGYEDFYMSNDRLSSLGDLQLSFYKSLKKYIHFCKDAIRSK